MLPRRAPQQALQLQETSRQDPHLAVAELSYLETTYGRASVEQAGFGKRRHAATKTPEPQMPAGCRVVKWMMEGG